MGLKKTLSADQNFMGVEFKDAYWRIENLGFGDDGGGTYIAGCYLRCYPSRESAKKTEQNLEVGSIPEFGGSIRPCYESRLYDWFCAVPVEAAFPNGVPSDYNEAKTIMYKYIKALKPTVGFEDILEEGQTAEVPEQYKGVQKTSFDQYFG